MMPRRFAAEEEERFRLSRQLALAEINAQTFWLVAALVMAFSWWDWYVDPSNWFAAFVVRFLGAGAIIGTGVVQKVTGRVDWSARIAKVRYAAGTVSVACALALLDRGFLVGVAGLVAVILSGPYIAIDLRDLVVMNLAPLFLIAVIIQTLTGVRAFSPGPSPLTTLAFAANILVVLGTFLAASLTGLGAWNALRASGHQPAPADRLAAETQR
jgi:hypothetical protein